MASPSARRFCGRRFVGLPTFLGFLTDCRRFLDAIAFTGDGDDLGVVQEPIQDGLYGSDNAITTVLRFRSFGTNWTASVLASQDPVAIDSVVVAILRNEPLMANNITGQGVDNYLHEAAQAGNPPSGSFYDPASTGTRLASLGVHEHWNNATNKLYSRNLGRNEGIELLPPGRSQRRSGR